MASVLRILCRPIGRLFARVGICCAGDGADKPAPIRSDPYLVDGVPFKTELFQLDGDPPTSAKNEAFLVLNATLKRIVQDNMKDLTYRMQNTADGVPMRTVRRLFADVPAVFTGIDLIMWIKNETEVDTDHALYFANLLSSHGYLFSIEHHDLKVKNDGGYYRFQSPYYWQCGTASSSDRDYAVYLCKRVSENSELAKYEEKRLEKLKKVFKNKWRLITTQADTELDAMKLQQSRNNQVILFSRERAFWNFHRPAPGVKVKREFNLEKMKKFKDILPG